MTNNAILQLGVYLVLLVLLAKPLGWYMVQVFQGKPAGLNQLGRPLERIIYRLCGIKVKSQMDWKEYAAALLLFNVLGTVTTYLIQRWQAWLPFNPQHFANVNADLAFNTAVSFATNTDWQAYAGETTMSYLTQMLGLTSQNFFSAASALVVAIALMRSFTQRNVASLGNFWVDITRAVFYILLPLSLLLSIIFMSQGVIQNFKPYQQVTTLQSHTQVIPMGPVASQEAIKVLGTNGGGFFNANSAHPFENPTPLSNLLQMLAIFMLPAGLCFSFGILVGDQRQGWVIFIVMLVLFTAAACVTLYAEQQSNPLLTAAGVDQTVSLLQPGGNMEGKETRFGITNSALFATITTASGCGATSATYDSFMPIGGMIPMWLIQLGEVVFGGVGSGLYGMLIFAILAVFIAGLMIGRTPEYLGKKIESFEMKMMAIVILVPPILVLLGTASAVMLPAGIAGIFNPGAHGFSEVLYAFSSVANNNGSAFAGLAVNTVFYNLLLGTIMWLGRFGTMVPVLAIAGALAYKKRLNTTSGSLPTHGPLFIALLLGVVIMVGALTYLPALALGPIVEQLQLIIAAKIL